MDKEHLMALSEEALFKEMDRAYSRQAYVVDNNGSDDDSYSAERSCELVEEVIKARSLSQKYDERSE